MVDFNLSKNADRSVLDTQDMIDQFWPFKRELDGMMVEAQAVVVVDDNSMAQASEMISQAKKLSNAIGKRRLVVTRPLLEAKKAVDGAVNKLTDACAALIRVLDGKTIPYMRNMEIARQKEAARVAAEMRAAAKAAEEKEEAARVAAAAAAKAEAEALGYGKNEIAETVADAVAAVVPVAPEVPAGVVEDRTKVKTASGSATLEYVYVGELTDIRVLPQAGINARWAQIQTAVQPWINAQIKFGLHEIPGVRVTRQQVVKRRVR